tara:strand:+ start:1538 stop:1918 length:381 start_codon:yes stop_codon:yes gene_type:complete
MEVEDIIGFALIGVIIIYIYLWPARVAFKKNNPFKQIILLVNIFFGWTFVVWFILLIYVYFPNKKTILDPIIDPSGTMSAKNYGNRINDLKTHSNKITSIKQLYELKQMGAITEEEFQNHRNQLKL